MDDNLGMPHIYRLCCYGSSFHRCHGNGIKKIDEIFTFDDIAMSFWVVEMFQTPEYVGTISLHYFLMGASGILQLFRN